ncbi:MAG: tRNA (adenosine(37)-N6)-threonylcarbamoyltransferase complex transferase subunit TsaD, partial [Ardenticatenia bacterium]
AGFQQAVIDVLVGKVLQAVEQYGVQVVVMAGGVAANRPLREQMQKALERHNVALHVAPIALCTDNAAMIAGAAYYRLVRGERSPLDLDVDPNAPLAL